MAVAPVLLIVRKDVSAHRRLRLHGSTHRVAGAECLRDAHSKIFGGTDPMRQAFRLRRLRLFGTRESMNTGKEEKIRQRAYEIWQREGRPSGRDRDHWSQAQAEITREEREGNLGTTSAMGGNGGQSQPSASSVADASSGEEASRRVGRRGKKPKAEGEAPKRRTTTRPRSK